MAETSGRRASPWVAFFAGALVVVVVVLGWMAWSGAREATDRARLALTVPRAPMLPLPHRLPEGPKLPPPPIPTPK